jgi:4-amino-4-deoxy-L-arabinose transferase-like glycosyltransferase
MSRQKIIKIAIISSIVFFLLLSSFLRIYHLGYSSFWIDEGYTINASLSILEKGIPLLDSGKFYNQGLLYNYLTAGSIKVFGFDPFSPWSTRVPSLIFGLLSILAVFFLVKELFNKNIAFLPSFILAFSSWHIAWSQQARGYTSLQFFIILSLYFLWKWLKDSKSSNFIFFTLSFVCAYLSHNLAFIFIPSFLIIFISYLILHPQFFSFKKIFSFPIIISILIVGIISFRSVSGIIPYGFLKGYLSHLFGSMLPFTLLTLGGIILGFFSKKHFWPSVFLFIALIFPLIIILEYGPQAHMRYLFPMFFLLVIFSAYFLISLIKKIPLPSYLQKFKIPIILLLAIIIFFNHLVFIPQKHYSLKWGSPQPNFKEAYSIIKKEKTEKDIVISPYTHLSKIYLNDPGIWFPISLSGRTSQVKQLIEQGSDYYTGAPLIESKEHFVEILDNENGFVVLDMMATIRIRNQFREERFAHPKIEEIYKSGSGLNAIWLYKF